MNSLSDILRFIWRRKKWWLVPVIVILLTVALVLIFAGSTGLGPFIYPLF
jgi:hypothetical protein